MEALKMPYCLIKKVIYMIIEKIPTKKKLNKVYIKL